MLTEILNLFFLFSALIISAYLIRHYIFTLTVLRNVKNKSINAATCRTVYEPSVSILIPAHNEDKVIGRLLQKMTELSYPKDKLEIILIDDA
jgi:cellulose synthase/poly-beta-1,6-N-acetylglucosamine synthase-like glycosyltransferase